MVLTPSKKSIFDYNLLWPALVWGTGNYMTYIDDGNSQQFLTLSEFHLLELQKLFIAAVLRIF